MTPRQTSSLLLLLALTSGAALALAAMPWLVSRAPSDSAELCDALRLCRSRAQPRVVVLGNSTAVFGVDAVRLPRPAWNLASAQQSTAESFFLQQEVPRSATIVQFMTLWQLEAATPFEADHLTMLKMCGWRAAPKTRAAFARAFGGDYATDLDPRPLHDRFAARTHLRAALEATLRDRLRAGRPGGWRPEQLLAQLDVPHPRFEVMRSQVLMLREAVAAARRDGQRYLVVLPPMHPRRRAIRGPAVDAFRAAVAAEATDVLDLTDLLAEAEFRDPTHATVAGAKKVTDAIAARLR